MIKHIALLGLILLASFIPAHSADTKDEALGRATGALGGTSLYLTYLAFSDAERIISENPDDEFPKLHVARYFTAIKILQQTDTQLRTVFADDPTFVAYLDSIKEAGQAVAGMGQALVKYLDSKDEDDLKAAREKKEVARKLLIPLLKMPDKRDVLP